LYDTNLVDDMENGLKKISIATFNVHMWYDGDYVENFDRVLKLVRDHDPEIVCLQEATGEGKQKFANETKYKYFSSRGGCAIYSKFPIRPVYDNKEGKRVVGDKNFPKNVRFTTVVVQPNNTAQTISDQFYLTCLHLDHRYESTRLKELLVITKTLNSSTSRVNDSSAPHIWVGDFNSLTKDDYTVDEWNEITRVRKVNCWERPHVDATEMVKSSGMLDCWELSGKPLPIKTCRFDTRIDYIYVSPTWLDKWNLDLVRTIDDNASDHNMVIATFKSKDY